MWDMLSTELVAESDARPFHVGVIVALWWDSLESVGNGGLVLGVENMF